MPLLLSTDMPGISDSGPLAELPSISLPALNDAAELQKRVDRKYIVTASELVDVVDHLSHRLAALEIDGQRSFGYESTYFDTPDLQSFHGAARRRRRRFKVRIRAYLDSERAMLEVKTRGTHGKTVKKRQSHDFDARRDLDERSLAFIDAKLGVPGVASTLRPSLVTTYRRTTLIDLDDVARVTIDADLRFVDAQQRRRGLADRFVLETKSTSQPGAADRYLWQLGVRPTKISKYGTGLASLDNTLPANKWHRTLQRHFS